MDFNQFRAYLEIVFFVSNPIIAIGSVVALTQYFKFSKDIDSKYGREIARQAIEDVATFNSVIMPAYLSYSNELKGLMGFQSVGERLTLDNLDSVDVIESAESFRQSISQKAIQHARELITELNRISLSLELRLSDEEKAFKLIGVQFVEIFQGVAFMAILMRKFEGANLMAAFNTHKKWKTWIDLRKAQSELSDKERIVAALEVRAEPPVKPIGL
jgi:hypothetical protein